MIDARLPLVLEGSGVAWPEGGRLAVYGPPTEAGLTALTGFDVQIIEGFRPSHDIWKTRGYDCAVAAEGQYDGAIVSLPRSKLQGRALIAEALELTDGPVLVDGQKTDGIDSILKDVRKRTGVSGPVSKAHGKLFAVSGSDADEFTDWRIGPSRTDGGFWTAPGVFSADAVDPASALLADALPDRLGKTVADLGAGWGFLSAHVLVREDVKTVHLVEAGHMALECARRNVTDPRAAFHWADAPSWQPPATVDSVVMNPPFHTGRAADPALGQSFVAAAARILAPHGQLWMVANRHLPYETTLQKYFVKVTETGSDNRFKLFHAARPVRRRK
ncbi:class I SAM-dependent methyltransferase [uncultured Roseobacter sp.]|uniref:class I SAM-dependent methyltransferase n=1 Tax=uncultured Roseobacter sp. TaxID=114847 RepID=UPI0026175523|nr:class I SAM-dependent methyltransferase [uncultured Roseobacter sp.]